MDLSTLTMAEIGDYMIETHSASEWDVDLIGCTESEIEALEHEAGGRFPDRYREFLAVMGRFSGDIMIEGVGLDCNDLLPIRNELFEHYKDRMLPLPKDAWIIRVFDFDQIFYIRLGDPNPDPVVYKWFPGKSQPERSWPTFSAYILQCIRDIRWEYAFARFQDSGNTGEFPGLPEDAEPPTVYSRGERNNLASLSFNQIADLLIQMGIATQRGLDIIGLDEHEIAQLEHQAELVFPHRYRDFLAVMGRKAGSLFDGMLLAGAGLHELQPRLDDAYHELLNTPRWNDRFIVAAFDFNQLFCFRRSNNADDPPIYRWYPWRRSPAYTWLSFSDFIDAAIQACRDPYLAAHAASAAVPLRHDTVYSSIIDPMNHEAAARTFLRKINDLRQTWNLSPWQHGAFAEATIKTGFLKSTEIALTAIGCAEDTTAHPWTQHTVRLRPPHLRRLRDTEPTFNLVDYAGDADARLLEEFAERLEPDSKGTIVLYSELFLSDAAMRMVDRFRAMFPRIRLDIVSKTRGVYGMGPDAWQRMLG